MRYRHWSEPVLGRRNLREPLGPAVIIVVGAVAILRPTRREASARRGLIKATGRWGYGWPLALYERGASIRNAGLLELSWGLSLRTVSHLSRLARDGRGDNLPGTCLGLVVTGRANHHSRWTAHRKGLRRHTLTVGARAGAGQLAVDYTAHRGSGGTRPSGVVDVGLAAVDIVVGGPACPG